MNAHVIPYSANYEQAYLDFAKISWGQDSYQSTFVYLRWLYSENPSLHKKEGDFLLVITENQKVVGCIHKLRMPWISEGVPIEIPAVHNLIVDEQYRGSYALPLIFKSFHDDEHVLIPGATPPVSTIYERLKSQLVHVQHYRKILRPVSAVIQKVFKIKKSARLPYYVPSEALLVRMVKALKRRALKGLSVDWTLEFVRWRFFHELGPRHFLVYRELQDDEIDFMIVSLGSRHGLNVARIIESVIKDKKNAYSLMAEAEAIAKKQGAHVFFGYGFEKSSEYLMDLSGWRKINNPAKTYFYHRNKANHFASFHVSMSCADFGFEAMTG